MGDLSTVLGISNDLLLIATIYAIVVVAAFWLAMVVWVYRDMRSRSRDSLVQLATALMVAVLIVPGLIIYLFLRPRETLAEAYERSLEEEALLQEIEEKSTCPGCGQKVQENWQACPNCFTRLKKPCVHCRQMLELAWQVCPYCATAQPGYQAERSATGTHQHVRPASVPEDAISPRSIRAKSNNAPVAEPLEFIEGEEL
jgi:hypothetical protein